MPNEGNRDARRRSDKAKAERAREKEERRATADARIAANPRLVRHKFRKV
ncbi:MAG: hypothetical protein IJ781_06160 [Atopobiaceae bacterium]|nr:hypothetical protein [Atopobiaceae bacterium]